MMRRLFLLPALVAGLTGCSFLALAEDPLDVIQARVIRVSQDVSSSVVHIQSAVKVNNRRNLATGSGFLIDPTGIVMTNHHVVDRAERVTVLVPGRDGRYHATIIGTDKQTDLAVLRISPRAGEEPFKVVRLGDSDALRVGEWVIAIGNPYGLEGTVSLGILSAKGRDLRTSTLLNDFLQTDAMIDRGSSGGPLINLAGEVIGVNSRGQGRGIGFTIPINTARRVSNDLLGAGVERAYLGVTIQPLNRELAEYWDMTSVHGLIVNGVAENSPAEAAGLKSGDIVTRFDGESIGAEKDEDLGTFQRKVADSEVGRQVEVEVLRDGESQQIQITLGSQPKVVPDEEATDLGFTVQEVTESLYRQYRLDDREGVLVSFVERGSEAAEASMRVGDLIILIEETRVSDIESFRASLDAVDISRPFLITARRGDNQRFMLLVPRDTQAPRTSAPDQVKPQTEG